MKKFAAILLAAVMLCSFAAADEILTAETSWDDVKDLAEPFGGEFIQLEVPAGSIWLPDAFTVFVPEEEPEDESLADRSLRLVAKGEAFSGIEISIHRTDMEVYCNAKDDIAARLLAVAPDLLDCTLNGYPSLVYYRQISDNDYRCFAYIWDEAYPVSIVASSEEPIESEDFRTIFSLMAVSYRPE